MHLSRFGLLLVVLCILGELTHSTSAAVKKTKRQIKREQLSKLPPTERFDNLPDFVAHMCGLVCRATARKLTAYETFRGRVELKSTCTVYCDRLQHMIYVSGNDALIQLEKEEDKKKRHRGATNYYKLAIERASSGKHLELLKRIVRRNADWILKVGSDIDVKRISDAMEPEIGQWLLNVASGTDPTLTNADLNDAAPEEEYPEDGEENDDEDEL
eukprot:PhF_6_TR11335/c0_g1_i1/m.18307